MPSPPKRTRTRTEDKDKNILELEHWARFSFSDDANGVKDNSSVDCPLWCKRIYAIVFDCAEFYMGDAKQWRESDFPRFLFTMLKISPYPNAVQTQPPRFLGLLEFCGEPQSTRRRTHTSSACAWHFDRNFPKLSRKLTSASVLVVFVIVNNESSSPLLQHY